MKEIILTLGRLNIEFKYPDFYEVIRLKLLAYNITVNDILEDKKLQIYSIGN